MPRRSDVTAAVRIAGWRLALPALRRGMALERLLLLTSSPRERPPSSDRVEAATRVCGRFWRDSSAPCLERSICLHRQLGLAGASPVLVLGLADDHRGHAWVELDGRALIEPSPPQSRYAVLMRFDARGELIEPATVRASADA